MWYEKYINLKEQPLKEGFFDYEYQELDEVLNALDNSRPEKISIETGSLEIQLKNIRPITNQGGDIYIDTHANDRIYFRGNEIKEWNSRGGELKLYLKSKEVITFEY